MKLSDRFNTIRLLRFAFPTICMMVFTSIYGVVDGFFISNFAGKTSFAAINFIMPVIMILCCPGMMIGSGGSALVARTMGEEDLEQARRQFSLLAWFAADTGIILAAAAFIGMDPLLKAMGCLPDMMEDASLYGRIIAACIPFYLMQVFFQTFFVTAEKPKYGFYFTLASGIVNMVLDYVFVGLLGWKVAGAALATNAGILIGSIGPLFYFMKKRSSLLYFVKTSWQTGWILQTLGNGCSELLTNISMNLVGILYNFQLLRYIGPDGVSAYGVLMYVMMVFSAIFLGFTFGTAPILSYQFGAGNKKELGALLKRSVAIILCFSLLMFASGQMLAKPLSMLFVGYDDGLLSITVHAFHIFSFGFLFMGIAIYGSGFFTALSDGFTSALISFLRTLVFQTGAVLLFPVLMGVEGVWWSIVLAEIAAFLLVFLFLYIRKRNFLPDKPA